MLKRVIFQNVQAHQKSILNLHRGVNVITGVSDSGKSSLIRGLRLLIDNKPSGNSIRSWWKGVTYVKGVFDDGNEIKRIKSSKNVYVLNNSTLADIGQRVPEKVRKIINMNHINCQFQFDSFFLISEKNSVVAKHFNDIARLNKIDSSLSYVKKQLHKAQADKRNLISSIDEKKQELQEYKGVDDLYEQIKRCELLGTSIKKHTENIREISKAITGFKVTNSNMQKYENIHDVSALLQSVLDVQNKIKKEKSKIESVHNLVYIHTKTKAQLRIYEAMCELKKLLQGCKTAKEHLQHKKDELNKITPLIKQAQSTIIGIKNRKELILKQQNIYAKNMPSKCPLCNSKIKKK